MNIRVKAHAYCEVIFGYGQTFRAGTIGTLADKTAFGYIKNYYEERGVHKRNCEIDRIVQGCVGVRRTTGQHRAVSSCFRWERRSYVYPGTASGERYDDSDGNDTF